MVFQPGVSGNPAGKKPGTLSVVAALKKKLAEVDDTDIDKRTYLSQLIDSIIEKGIKDKDVGMIKDIINRTDGLPKETLDHNVLFVKPLASLNDLRKDDSDTKDSKLNEKD